MLYPNEKLQIEGVIRITEALHKFISDNEKNELSFEKELELAIQIQRNVILNEIKKVDK